MKLNIKAVLGFFASFLLPIIVPAQNLPVIQADKSISNGTLPNGMTYYIVANTTEKGMADFSLVKKGEGQVFGKKNVFVSVSESVMDSTLLHVMETADQWSPADQAVIVSGDVNVASVTEKIKMLSYMTPVRDTASREAYVWQTGHGLDVVTSNATVRNLAEVKATWRSQRTARQTMNTIQPAISAIFAGQLGIIAADRIETCMRQAGIPATGISYSHIDGSMTPGDEEFSIGLSVAPEHVEQAVRILAYVMSSLDSGTATAQEIRRSQSEYLRGMYEVVALPVLSNAGYVQRCSSAFLYNSALASPRAVYDFHASRQLDEQTSISLFNGIVSALLDNDMNVTLECISPVEVDAESMESIFLSAWDMESNMTWQDKADVSTVLKAAYPDKKMKISSSKKDPMSGASVMLLDNGLTVICKDMPSDRRIYYSLALNGGFDRISSIAEGEAAFVEDYIGTCRVGGMSMKDFRASLAEKGISMDFDVSMSGLSVSGSASRYDMLTLVQALSALTRKLEPDQEALDYLLKTIPLEVETMKGTRQERMAAIDGIMCSDFVHSEYMSSSPVSPEFGSKMWSYLSGRFGRINDGVLVFAGDVDESELRKILAVYGHEFTVENRPSPRPSLRFQPISGVSTYTVKGGYDTIDLAMSARYPFTSDNYFSCMIAAMQLREDLCKAFDGSGWSVDVREGFTLHPDERFNMVVTLVGEDGERALNSMEAMSRLRSAVTDISSSDLDDARMKAYKNYLKNRMAVVMGDPSFWVETIASRQLFGKDIISGYASRCDAVTTAKVKQVLKVLNEGGKVEYITEK